MPHLGRDFRLRDSAFDVPATDGIVVATWAIEPGVPPADTCASEHGPDRLRETTCASPDTSIEETR
jgi:hypothetical protein